MEPPGRGEVRGGLQGSALAGLADREQQQEQGSPHVQAPGRREPGCGKIPTGVTIKSEPL